MSSKTSRIFLNFFLLILLSTTVAFTSFSIDDKYIFINSKLGSRSHSALNSLLNKNSLKDEKIFFCKSCKDAIEKAEKQHGIVFFKLVSTPNFYIHADVIKALQKYKISKIHALVKQKANYCLLRHTEALKKRIPLTEVASSPYTLNLYKKWIKDKNLSKIEVPAGSPEAARLLSDKILSLKTGVIASAHVSSVYDNLKIVKLSLESIKSYDIFAMVEVKKRNKIKNTSEVKSEINHIFEKETVFQK